MVYENCSPINDMLFLKLADNVKILYFEYNNVKGCDDSYAQKRLISTAKCSKQKQKTKNISLTCSK